MTDDPVFDRASVYLEAHDGGERVVYRASGLGYCLGALARARLGMTPAPPPDTIATKYQEGHDWEAKVLAAGLGVDWAEVAGSELERLGTVVDGQHGERQVERDLALNAAGTRVVRVHPDAIVRKVADKTRGELAPLHVCEAKFLAADDAYQVTRAEDFVAALGELRPAYLWQLSVQMLAFDMPALYVIGAKERDSDGNVTGVAWATSVVVDQPPYSLFDIKMRVAQVEAGVARGEMPACPVPFDFPCGYWADHEARDGGREEIVDDVLSHLVGSYARNRAKAEAIQTEYDAIRQDIGERMAELEVDSGMCSGWGVTVTKPRPGNVSWSKWAKEVQRRWPEVKELDTEEYRGDEVAGGVKIEKPK